MSDSTTPGLSDLSWMAKLNKGEWELVLKRYQEFVDLQLEVAAKTLIKWSLLKDSSEWVNSILKEVGQDQSVPEKIRIQILKEKGVTP